MNDHTMLHPFILGRDEERKRKFRADVAAWQRIAVGALAVSAAVNVAQQAAILRKEASIIEKNKEIVQLQERCDVLVAIEKDAIQAYGDLVKRVEAEENARVAQTIAYNRLSDYRYIGECTITAYCPCEECCGPWADGLTATGILAVPGIVAVDPAVIPIGSTVIIDGQQYLAADTGNAIKGQRIDIFVEDHQTASNFGVNTAEVWVVEP